MLALTVICVPLSWIANAAPVRSPIVNQSNLNADQRAALAGSVRAQMFISGVQTGTGAPQNIVHTLGYAPTRVVVVPVVAMPQWSLTAADVVGNAAGQNTAHSLACTPTCVPILYGDITTVSDTVTPGVHDGTNCTATVTAGVPYRWLAMCPGNSFAMPVYGAHTTTNIVVTVTAGTQFYILAM